MSSLASLRSCSLPSTPFLKTLEKSWVRVSSNPSSAIPHSTPRLSLPARLPALMSSLKASLNEDIDASVAVATIGSRIGEVNRVTKETDVYVKINLDGTGVSECSTGIPFLDHMLDQLASHGLFDICVKASGDIHIDYHRTNEDVALAIGMAFLHALGDRKGIQRFGNLTVPLDEAAVEVILLVEHFFQSLVNTSGMILYIQQRAGRN